MQISIIFNAQFIIFNTKLIMFGAESIILNTKLIILHAKSMIFTANRAPGRAGSTKP